MSLCCRFLRKSRKIAKMEKVSIMVNDHGSTVPKARGEKIKINTNIPKIILVIF
jgi:hypothetical protein